MDSLAINLNGLSPKEQEALLKRHLARLQNAPAGLKRPRNDEDDVDNINNDAPGPSKKKKMEESNKRTKDSQSNQPQSPPPPRPLVDTSTPSFQWPDRVHRSEYFRNLHFASPPPGMVLNRPKGNFNPKDASPWGLKGDHDGWLQFITFIHTLAASTLLDSKGWLEQGVERQTSFVKEVKAKYPVLHHQLTAFTIIKVTSGYLDHKKNYDPKKTSKEKSKKAPKSRKGNGLPPSTDPNPSPPLGAAPPTLTPTIETGGSSSVALTVPGSSAEIPVDPALSAESAPGLQASTHFQPVYANGGVTLNPPLLDQADAAQSPPAADDTSPPTVMNPDTLARSSNNARKRLKFKVPQQEPPSVSSPSGSQAPSKPATETPASAPSKTSSPPPLSSTSLIPNSKSSTPSDQTTTATTAADPSGDSEPAATTVSGATKGKRGKKNNAKANPQPLESASLNAQRRSTRATTAKTEAAKPKPIARGRRH